MKLTWYPDVCVGGQCRMEVSGNPENLVIYEQLCSHHNSLRATLNLTQVHRATYNSTQAKESARWALKQEFMANGTIDDDYVSEVTGTSVIDKEWPGAKFKVDPNGDIIIETGTIRIPPQARQRLSKLVDDESKKIEQVPGISRILRE